MSVYPDGAGPACGVAFCGVGCGEALWRGFGRANWESGGLQSYEVGGGEGTKVGRVGWSGGVEGFISVDLIYSLSIPMSPVVPASVPHAYSSLMDPRPKI